MSESIPKEELDTRKQKCTPEEKAQKKREYNRSWYTKNKEKKIEQSRNYYKEHIESASESNLKLQERYRECYRILKEIMQNTDILPEEYRIKATNALNIGK